MISTLGGPFEGSQGLPPDDGAPAMNGGSAAGGDGRTVVLKGFPSFLHIKFDHIT